MEVSRGQSNIKNFATYTDKSNKSHETGSNCQVTKNNPRITQSKIEEIDIYIPASVDQLKRKGMSKNK